jgi:hypothetical protein
MAKTNSFQNKLLDSFEQKFDIKYSQLLGTNIRIVLPKKSSIHIPNYHVNIDGETVESTVTHIDEVNIGHTSEFILSILEIICRVSLYQKSEVICDSLVITSCKLDHYFVRKKIFFSSLITLAMDKKDPNFDSQVNFSLPVDFKFTV